MQWPFLYIHRYYIIRAMQIDFYISKVNSDMASYNLVAKLVAKAYQQQRQVLILARNVEQAQLIDDALWTFEDISFIPHGIIPDVDSETLAIQICYEMDHQPKIHDILINLADHIPDWHPKFQRIIEIVHQGNKAARRERFTFYKDREYKVQSHNV